jgi:hypothetical protein
MDRPLRRFHLTGWNDMRQLQFTMEIEAMDAGQAVRLADNERELRNLVRANTWRTYEMKDGQA